MKTTAAKHRYLDPATVQKIGSLSLVAHRAIEGLRTGAHRSVLRGFSTEFAHHRPYTTGDGIRHVDWRVYGRSERYYTKLYEAENNFEAHLLLDASSSMRYGLGSLTKLEYAKYLAASLAYLIIEQRDSVGLAVYDSVLRGYVPPSSSRAVIERIDELLRATKPEPRTDLGALLDEFAQRIKRRGFVLVFSDLFDEPDKIAKGLDHLRFRGQNVILFHTLDPDELKFPFDGTCRFVGLEGEAEPSSPADWPRGSGIRKERAGYCAASSTNTRARYDLPEPVVPEM